MKCINLPLLTELSSKNKFTVIEDEKKSIKNHAIRKWKIFVEGYKKHTKDRRMKMDGPVYNEGLWRGEKKIVIT
jgi:hypothetical protein